MRYVTAILTLRDDNVCSSNSWRLPPDETLQVADPKAKKAEVGDEEVSTPQPGKITTAPHLSVFLTCSNFGSSFFHSN